MTSTPAQYHVRMDTTSFSNNLGATTNEQTMFQLMKQESTEFGAIPRATQVSKLPNPKSNKPNNHCLLKQYNVGDILSSDKSSSPCCL
mmetsp:Transcript_143309/g.260770  ORF Transcript_143309/g.260770 Transcript_143309/m.260770 type:complete len:88 (-) Transcript_143309:421-684(-)